MWARFIGKVTPRGPSEGVGKVSGEGRGDRQGQRGLDPTAPSEDLSPLQETRKPTPAWPRGCPPKKHDLERSGGDSDPGLTQSLVFVTTSPHLCTSTKAGFPYNHGTTHKRHSSWLSLIFQSLTYLPLIFSSTNLRSGQTSF